MNKKNLTENRIFFPLKWKLVVHYAIFMLLILFIGLYINLGKEMSSRLFKEILNENARLEVVGEKVVALKLYTENFLAVGNLSALQKCLETNAQLQEETNWLEKRLRLLSKGKEYYLLLDLKNSLTSFSDLADHAIVAKRDNNTGMVNELNAQLVLAADLNLNYLRNVMNQIASLSNERYEKITRQTKKIEYIAYVLALVTALLSFIFSINFAWGITEPLSQIIKRAQKISAGEFKVAEVKVDSHDEVQIIARVFNDMSRNIHDSFHTIQEKVELERQLKAEQMRNLEINNLLRETELKTLQAQINPHFLYNTLNAISQVAILEEASETGELIKAVAGLLRYNLRSLNQPVTVQDELNHVKEYFYIMKVRFGERITYKVSSGRNLDRFLMPGMTLQPLVENALIHGVGPLTEQQGKIVVNAKEGKESIVITISDNGVGMDEQTLASSFMEKRSGLKRSHGNGIGLANIFERLRHFYSVEDLISITSKPGRGTRVVLNLPFVEEGKQHA